MRKQILLVCLLGIAFLGRTQPSDTLKVLFVGNSYTYFNNLPHIVSLLSDSTDIKLITSKSTRGNSWLHQHWHEKNGIKSKTKIKEGDYDVVVLQEYSMGAISKPDSLRQYAKLLSDHARFNGAKPYLFLVWARQRVPQYQAELDVVYEKVAKQNDITLLPVGKAWELARDYRPSAPLFDADGTHPADLGTFLTAATMVGIICGKVPKTFTSVPTIYDQFGESIELMRLDWLDVIFALKVADEAVDKYGNKAK